MALRRIGLIMMSVGLCTGCAGVSPMQVGQTAGTIAGAAVAPGVGAPLGALVGLLAGMVFQKKADQVVEKRERSELSDQLQKGPSASSSEPALAPLGEPTRVWVDETLHDGRLVAGHFDVRNIQ